MFLKQDTVLRMELPYQVAVDSAGKCANLAVDLWGTMLMYKGSERTKVKFKEKGCLDLY